MCIRDRLYLVLCALPLAGFATETVAMGLPTALAQVLATDPQVRAAQAQEAAALANVKRLRSRLFPTLQLQADSGSSDEVEDRVTLKRRTGQTSMALSWNLYNGGADFSEFEAAELELRTAQQDVRRIREEVGARIAKAWTQLVQQSRLEKMATTQQAYVLGLMQKMQQQLSLIHI